MGAALLDRVSAIDSLFFVSRGCRLWKSWTILCPQHCVRGDFAVDFGMDRSSFQTQLWDYFTVSVAQRDAQQPGFCSLGEKGGCRTVMYNYRLQGDSCGAAEGDASVVPTFEERAAHQRWRSHFHVCCSAVPSFDQLYAFIGRLCY